VVLPFATGLVTARRWPALGKRLARLATPMTLAVLAGAVAITVMGAPLRRLLTSAPPLVLATVGLNATNLLAGYLTGGLAPGVALSFSVRNGTVAMAVAAGPAFSSMPTALASIVVYAGIQSLTSAALIGTIKRRSARQAVT
jgi:predicted Na+-dependent transporter